MIKLNINLKKVVLFLLLSGLFIISYGIDFPQVRSFFLDFSQNFNSEKNVSHSLKTVNIDFGTNNLIKRPLTHDSLKIILEKIYELNPKNTILMISPRELSESVEEKNKILKLFQTYDNLYLFSPYTNGPLGGFHQDPVFQVNKNHFDMPLTKDVLFGAKDSKIRRVMLSYQNKGEQEFILKMRDMGYVIKDNSQFKYFFQLWDTTQVYQKTYKAGAFGQIKFSDFLNGSIDKQNLKGATFLLGSFDEFSVHVSPSIFNFSGKLEKDNFDSYFYPVNETAADVMNLFLTGDYVKYLDSSFLLLSVFLFVVYVLIFSERLKIQKKMILLFLVIPLLLIIYLLTYIIGDFFLDISTSVIFMLVVQYFGLPFLFFAALKKSEENRNEIVNQVRIDSLLSVAEKVAHDIRSPLSSINLIASSLGGVNQEKIDLIKSASKRIDEIAQNILFKQKAEFANLYNYLEVVNIGDLMKKVIDEKKVISSNVKYEINVDNNSLVLGNKTEIERIVSNIIDNSIYALEKVSNPKILIRTFASESHLNLEIVDNGPGIPANILALLGKVRFTTKSDISGASSPGNGIGLLNAKRSIEKMNGKFEIRNHGDQGTVVIMTFLRNQN